MQEVDLSHQSRLLPWLRWGTLVISGYFKMSQALKKQTTKINKHLEFRMQGSSVPEELSSWLLHVWLRKDWWLLLVLTCSRYNRGLHPTQDTFRIGTFIAMSGMCSSGASVEATVSRNRQNSSHSLGSVNKDTVSSLWSLKTLISLIDWFKSGGLMCWKREAWVASRSPQVSLFFPRGKNKNTRMFRTCGQRTSRPH